MVAITASQAVLARHLDPDTPAADDDTIATLLAILDDHCVVQATFDKIRHIVAHHFRYFACGERPRDHDGHGRSLTYETFEHAEDEMPHAIKATDPKGHWGLYEITMDGREPVQSLGYDYRTWDDMQRASQREGARPEHVASHGRKQRRPLASKKRRAAK